MKNKDFIIEGHRGVQSLWPENTLDSFRAAMDLGVDFVELDLLATSEGEIVIHHDYEVEGRLIRSLPLSEVKKVDCGSVINPNFPLQQPSPHAQIPLLRELFEMIQTSHHSSAKQLHFNLEIKSDLSHPEYTLPLPVLADKIWEIVQLFHMEDRVYFSSFNPEALFHIKKKDPRVVVAFLYAKGGGEDFLSKVLEVCMKLQAKIFSPLESLVTSEVVNACKEKKLLVIPWTVNDWGRYRELREMGVDGIITDYPQSFLSR